MPKAFVALKPQTSASADELMAYVGERVAPYKEVRRLEFVDTIPKPPTGKILRRLLVEREREGEARAASVTPPREFCPMTDTPSAVHALLASDDASFIAGRVLFVHGGQSQGSTL